MLSWIGNKNFGTRANLLVILKPYFYIWVEYHILQTKNQVLLAQNTKHLCSKADNFRLR